MDKREVERVTRYFSVLQNPLCIKVLLMLEIEELYVYEIKGKLGVTSAVASEILQKLRLLDIVSFEQESRRRRYFLKRRDILGLIQDFGRITRRKS